MAQVVTISATYGANGDIIGRRLAERLHLPFVDRAISPASAHPLLIHPTWRKARTNLCPVGGSGCS
jgi:hypothetical protein